MPISNQWWTFSESMIQHDRDDPGVYELGSSSDMVVHVGSSNELRRRLRQHLAESSASCIKKNTVKYRLEYTRDSARRERELYDEHIRLYGKPPACNEVRPPAQTSAVR